MNLRVLFSFPEFFAFYFLLTGLNGRKEGHFWNLAFSGFALSLGVHFKTVTIFYAVAMGIFVLLKAWQRKNFVIYGLKWGSTLLASFVLGLVLPIAYFAQQGRLDDFWQWTFSYSLFKYPANTAYLDKLYTKLLLIYLLFILAISASLTKILRYRIYRDDVAVLALLMGLISYLAVLKSLSEPLLFSRGSVPQHICSHYPKSRTKAV